MDVRGTAITDEETTKRQKRAKEDQEAVGGLRTLANSLTHMLAAAAGSKPVRAIVDKTIQNHSRELVEAMETLGKAGTLACQMQAAKEIRTQCLGTARLARRAHRRTRQSSWRPRHSSSSMADTRKYTSGHRCADRPWGGIPIGRPEGSSGRNRFMVPWMELRILWRNTAGGRCYPAEGYGRELARVAPKRRRTGT